MRLGALVFIATIMLSVGRSNASELSQKQVLTVLRFYDLLVIEKKPSVKQFFEIFGSDNEAELELRLRQKFPTLDINGNWFENEEAKKYIDEIFQKPGSYSSEFLQCIKVTEPTLFASKRNRLLEFPAETTNDFQRYSVLIHDKRVIFEFARGEYTLDNIYLSNGKSIYTLISKCVQK